MFPNVIPKDAVQFWVGVKSIKIAIMSNHMKILPNMHYHAFQHLSVLPLLRKCLAMLHALKLSLEIR